MSDAESALTQGLLWLPPAMSASGSMRWPKLSVQDDRVREIGAIGDIVLQVADLRVVFDTDRDGHAVVGVDIVGRETSSDIYRVVDHELVSRGFLLRFIRRETASLSSLSSFSA